MNKPLKFLIHGMTGSLGGTEMVIMSYYRNISSEKIQFDFLCVNEKPMFYQEIINNGSKVFIIPGRKHIFKQKKELGLIFKENKYDAFWSNRNNLSGTVIFFKLAYKYQVPLRILHNHNVANMGHCFLETSHKIDKYRIEKYVTDFWACSEQAGKYAFRKKIIDSDKLRIINNAIDALDFKFNFTKRDIVRKELKSESKLIIGNVARFHFQKNHDFLIRIFNEIYKKEPNAVLLLVGDGELRSEIEAMVKSLNLNDAVRFLGVRTDIPDLLNAMDMFIFPSKFEGLGISVIEAQAASLRSFASTNVPSAAKTTDLLSFIDLKRPPEEWANIILSQKNYARVDMSEEIRKAGYDIKTEAAKLEKYLLDRMGSVNCDK